MPTGKGKGKAWVHDAINASSGSRPSSSSDDDSSGEDVLQPPPPPMADSVGTGALPGSSRAGKSSGLDDDGSGDVLPLPPPLPLPRLADSVGTGALRPKKWEASLEATETPTVLGAQGILLVPQPTDTRLTSLGPKKSEATVESVADILDRIQAVGMSFTASADTVDERAHFLSFDESVDYGHTAYQSFDRHPEHFHAISEMLHSLQRTLGMGVVWSRRGFWYWFVFVWFRSSGKYPTSQNDQWIHNVLTKLLGLPMFIAGVPSQSSAYIYGDVVFHHGSSVTACYDGKFPHLVPTEAQLKLLPTFLDVSDSHIKSLCDFPDSHDRPFRFYLVGSLAEKAKRGEKIPLIVWESFSSMQYATAVGGIDGVLNVTGCGFPDNTVRITILHLLRTGLFSPFFFGDCSGHSYTICQSYSSASWWDGNIDDDDGGMDELEHGSSLLFEKIKWMGITHSQIARLGLETDEVAVRAKGSEKYTRLLNGVAETDDVNELEKMRDSGLAVDLDAVIMKKGIAEVARILMEDIAADLAEA